MGVARLTTCFLVVPSFVALAFGCSTSPNADTVMARADLGTNQAALEAAGITAISGTYGVGCDGRSDAGTDPWTISISDAPAPDELGVRRHNASCVLSLAALVADGDRYLASPTLSLGPSYAEGASSFAADGGAATFHGNAKINTVTFAEDFTIQLLVSAPPGSADGGTKVAILRAPSLLSTRSYAVIGGSTVTNDGPSTVVDGDLGLSPGTSVTGMPTGQPTGATHLGSDPLAVQAQHDLTTVYDQLTARPCPPANVLSDQDLAGKTLFAGVYCFAVTATLGVGTLTLDAQNDPDAYWIFQIGSTLSVGASTVTVINGGSACNVFWKVGSSATVLENASFAGNLVAYASITLNAGAAISPGRALARTGAVTMVANHVSKAACL